MQAVRDLLPARLSKKMERALGREETLRRVWPALVGSSLARNVQLKEFRGGVVIVSVPDRVWKGSLESLGKMILDAINRFCGEPVARYIEFVVDARLATQPPPAVVARSRPATVCASPSVDVPAGAIHDEALRRALLESAQKYFAAQGRRK